MSSNTIRYVLYTRVLYTTTCLPQFEVAAAVKAPMVWTQGKIPFGRIRREDRKAYIFAHRYTNP